MKKFRLIEEVGWMLTDEAKADKNLNAVDKNMLAILQFIEDGKSAHGEWFRTLIKHPKSKWDDDEYNSIEKYFSEFEIPMAYCTLNRSINKLLRLGYIDYKTGWYNNTTHQGMTPMIKLIKGTIPVRCSDIAIAKGNDEVTAEVTVNSEHPVNNAKLTTNKSDTCSNIAIAYEKEKENNKHTYNLSNNKAISNTSDISTYIGDYDDEDLEYIERYGIGKLSYILQYNDDWLPALEYLRDHPSKDNYDTIEAYWADNEEYLECLHNYNNNTLRITV